MWYHHNGTDLQNKFNMSFIPHGALHKNITQIFFSFSIHFIVQ